MVDRFSLRARLSLLLVLVLAAGLAAGLGALVMHAGARIGAESDAAIRLARELVETKAPQLASAADPHAELEKLFADVRRLRHVRIVQADAPQPAIRDRVAPEWFTTLVMPAPAESRNPSRPNSIRTWAPRSATSATRLIASVRSATATVARPAVRTFLALPMTPRLPWGD